MGYLVLAGISMGLVGHRPAAGGAHPALLKVAAAGFGGRCVRQPSYGDRSEGLLSKACVLSLSLSLFSSPICTFRMLLRSHKIRSPSRSAEEFL